MKLITELNDDVQCIIEEKEGLKKFFITGPLIQTELQNRNGCIYGRGIM